MSLLFSYNVSYVLGLMGSGINKDVVYLKRRVNLEIN